MVVLMIKYRNHDSLLSVRRRVVVENRPWAEISTDLGFEDAKFERLSTHSSSFFTA